MNVRSKVRILPILEETPRELKATQLTTCRDILLDFHHQKDINPKSNTSFNDCKLETVRKLIELYNKVPCVTISRKHAENKLFRLVKNYKAVKKLSANNLKTEKFKQKLGALFDISACTCKMIPKFAKGVMLCSCPFPVRIHEKEYEFLKDQRGERKMMISATVDVATTVIYDARTKRRKIDHIRTPTTSSEGPTSAPPSPRKPLQRTRGLQLHLEEQDQTDDCVRDPNYHSPFKVVKKLKLMDSEQVSDDVIIT